MVCLTKKELIPVTKSSFIRVKCPSCENEQNVFSNPSRTVKCLVCEKELMLPTGGKGIIKGKFVKNLEAK